MKPDELRAIQAPLKARYQDDPTAAMVTLKASGGIGEGITCNVHTGKALTEAGLHPATGGSGMSVCSGDMLLEALVACAGVTLNAVASALGIDIRDGKVLAEGDLDFRGTLAVDKAVPVGFQRVRVNFELDTNASAQELNTLIDLTQRYCVVYQTLCRPPQMSINVISPSATP
jgi:uncharacterized OsmC-like protein